MRRDVYEEIAEVKKEYKEMGDNVVEVFGRVYQQAVRLASAMHVDPTKPRISKRQMHRNNVTASCPGEYYRRVLATPMLQRFSSEIDIYGKYFKSFIHLPISNN